MARDADLEETEKSLTALKESFSSLAKEPYRIEEAWTYCSSASRSLSGLREQYCFYSNHSGSLKNQWPY